MKIKIRKGVFETNSSSTHSICISKCPINIDTENVINFEIGEYGWENDCVNIKNYLYTAIMSFNDRFSLLEKFITILNNNHIEYHFQSVEIECAIYDGHIYSSLKDGYIDHCDDTREFVDAVLSDEDMCMRLLFGDSFVYTGNDNDDLDYATTNLNYNLSNYDYFYKGN
jgi:hypothetical protein